MVDNYFEHDTPAPKQVSHPFVVNTKSASPQRPAQDVLKSIIKSGIDFERAVKDRQINPSRVQINHLYYIIREEEPSLKDISLDDLKQVLAFVKAKSGAASEDMGRGKSEEIDLQDLMNVLLDVSLDVFAGD